jgi:hypothetical protein
MAYQRSPIAPWTRGTSPAGNIFFTALVDEAAVCAEPWAAVSRASTTTT